MIDPMAKRAPVRQVRASFTERTVRVYQAFSPAIARPAIASQAFKPPFSRNRMTWIKPSFTWMAYRSGWAHKQGQEFILGIDISREGFEWALAHSSMSAFEPGFHASHEEWQATLHGSPVRIQWDPERTLRLQPLPWRTIQIGLGGEAIDRYADEWVRGIIDATPLAREVEELVTAGDLEGASSKLPEERPYPLPAEVADRINCSE